MKLTDLINISWPIGKGNGLYTSEVGKIHGSHSHNKHPEAQYNDDNNIIFTALAPSNKPTDINRYGLIKINTQKISADYVVFEESNPNNILLTDKIIDFYIKNNVLQELIVGAIDKGTVIEFFNTVNTLGKLKEIIEDADTVGKLKEFVTAISCTDKLTKLKDAAADELKMIIEKLEREGKYLQQIIYGPAGVGKTYSIQKKAANELGITEYEKYTVHTVFHPEYSYFDFFGKVMPKNNVTPNSEKVSIVYDFYPGPFVEALLKSYEYIIKNKPEKILLVIDELNRGNSASIFGSLFNLLDRNKNGVSEYPLNIYGMEYDWLKKELKQFKPDELEKLKKYYIDKTDKKSFEITTDNSMKIFIPQNLSIICTMNTSDETIFSLDKAFERRWKKSFVTAKNSIDNYAYKNIILEDFKDNQSKDVLWIDFLTKINMFIKDNAELEDVDNATIGAYFIKPVCHVIKKEDIQYSLMYTLWFGLFKGWQRETLISKLPSDFEDVKTFEDFSSKVDEFIKAIYT